jgi:outer membrane protein OmpA-like peptidoglycan-associated protein
MAKRETLEHGKPERPGRQPAVAQPAPDLTKGIPAREARAPSASDSPAWNFSAIPVSRAPGSVPHQSDVGAANDPLEREADRTAEQVARMPDSSAAGATLRKKTSTPAASSEAAAPPTVQEALRSPGRPLDAEVRAFMEPRFGHDFSQVRLHSGAAAADSARALNAHAYTLGEDIVLASGKLAPSTKEGSRLLAHELTHVVQQGQGMQQIQRDKGSDDDSQYATGAEVEQALIHYLYAAQAAQGGRSLQVDAEVRTAVGTLAGSESVNPNDLLHMPIEEFAKNVRKVLGEKIPRRQMAHLLRLPAKKPASSKSWGQKKKEKANKMLGEIGKTPEDVRPPNGPTYPPGGEPKMGGDIPGQHAVPPQPVDTVGDWIDRGTGGPTAKNPPPSQERGTEGKQQTNTEDTPAPIHHRRFRRDGPSEPFLRSTVPAAPTLDLGEGLAESASPLVAASLGSLTIDGFVTGKADISGSQADRSARTAKIIVTLLKRYPASTVRVTGHTDAIGKEGDNQQLGQRRADSVQTFLTGQGVPAEAIRTQSAGATQLLVNSENAEPKNRRVEIQFETSTLLRDFGHSEPPPNLFPAPKRESLK